MAALSNKINFVQYIYVVACIPLCIVCITLYSRHTWQHFSFQKSVMCCAAALPSPLFSFHWIRAEATGSTSILGWSNAHVRAFSMYNVQYIVSSRLVQCSFQCIQFRILRAGRMPKSELYNDSDCIGRNGTTSIFLVCPIVGKNRKMVRVSKYDKSLLFSSSYSGCSGKLSFPKY